MRVGTLEETITVTGEPPTVDVQNVVTQRVVTRDVIDAIPTGSKSVAHPRRADPGRHVNNQDVGGSAFTSSQIAIHGSRPGEQQLLYDGMMYNNGQGRGGQFTAIATNDGTVQEISLETGGLGAESEMSGIRTQHRFRRKAATRSRGTSPAPSPTTTLQSDNLTDEFKAAGTADGQHGPQDLRHQSRARRPDHEGQALVLWVGPGVGGAAVRGGDVLQPEPVPWRYEADTTRPALNIETNGNESLRLTWQARCEAQDQRAVSVRPAGPALLRLLARPDTGVAGSGVCVEVDPVRTSDRWAGTRR